MSDFLNYLAIGLLIGGTYSLIASGVVLIFRTAKIFNFAIGEMVLAGGCICWVLMDTGMPSWLSILLTMLAVGIVGLLIERGLIRSLLKKSPLVAIISTAILSYLFLGIIVLFWGGTQAVIPAFFPTGAIILGDVFIPKDLLWSFATVIILFGVLALILRRTKTGLGVRATSENIRLSQSKGVPANRIRSLSWFIAGAAAAIAGVFLGTRMGVNPAITLMGLYAFPVVFIGGLESFPGVIVAGLVIGVAEMLVQGYIGSQLAVIVPWIIVVVILIIKPEGLFGEKRVERI
jgi:branched-chain amino acid transport system permease protein